MRLYRIALVFILVALSCGTHRAIAQPAQDAGLDIASLQAPADATVEDLLANRVGRVFVPTLERGLSLQGGGPEVNWVRLRGSTATAGVRQLRLQAPSGARVQLFLGEPKALPVERVTVTGSASEDALRFALRTPGPYTLFLRIEHEGSFLLVPEVLDPATHQQRRSEDRSAFVWLLVALLGLIAAGVIRHRQREDSNALSIAVAAGLFLLAAIVDESPAIGGIGAWFSSLRLLPWALMLIAFSRLLPMTAEFVAVGKYATALQPMVRNLSLLLPLLAVGLLFTPLEWVGLAEKIAALVIALTCFFAAILPMFDVRGSRWLPLLLWSAMLAMFLAYLLAVSQGYAWGLTLRAALAWPMVLLLAGFLLLPWLRHLNQQRDMAKRAEVPELSAEEKIAVARERLMQSLDAGLANADQDDLEWIAFRRLLAGLKPVLAQLSSAVVAKDYHGEDLLIPDAPEAEERYRQLLEHRGNILKNLSRMRAPQQVRIDFDDDGPMPMVMLAVIPLPIERPGWGALLIERADGVTYTEEELDLCAEFASLAWTAGDEASDSVAQRNASQTDAESGLGNRGTLDAALGRFVGKPGLTRGVLSCLLIRFEAGADLPSIAEGVRAELDFGSVLGRYDANHLLMLCPGKHGGPARELGDDILKSVRATFAARHLPPPRLSIGVSSMTSMERSGAAMLERAHTAVDKAEADGGNQTQVINAHA